MATNEGLSEFVSEFDPRSATQNFGERLKKEREKLGLSQRDMAQKVGVGLSSIQNYESGLLPKGDHLVKLAVALSCSVDWLLFGTKQGAGEHSEASRMGVGFPSQVIQPCDPELVMVPKVEARLSAGTGSLETSAEITGRFAFRSKWIRARGNPQEMVLMDIYGDSMEPEIKAGDTALIDQSQTDVHVGRIYAIGIDSEVFIKYVDRIPGKYILRSANKNYEPIPVDLNEESCNVRIIGRVVWWCREAR